MTSSKDLRVSLCGPGDREEQARLFDQCSREETDALGLAWRYDRVPGGEAISAVARPPGEAAVAGRACWPRLAVSFGKDKTAALVGLSGDAMTHPDWRRRGIHGLLDRHLLEEADRRGWPLVLGLAGRASGRGSPGGEWESVGRLRPWTLVLKADRAARRERPGDGRPRGLRAGLHRWAGRRARLRLRRQGALHAVEPLERFPPEVEGLSRLVERYFAFMLRRDADTLGWRFLDGPSARHRVLGVREPDGRFGGYVAVRPPRPAESVGRLVDLLAPSAGARAAAMEAGLSALEEAGASVVRATAIDGSWWASELRAAGFRPSRPDEHGLVLLSVRRASHRLVTAARRTESWYWTDGDRDDGILDWTGTEGS